ncbi:hypothetical protein [Aeromonas sp. MrichA-1]|uniref:hypothetical protein n=1 Tax=Aeromonas sp. MrichA-1 TaxID=2823362 RepID=UPI001B33366E|nr:hypothetical protein [Aeromonas sp. MrichA-1]MBP4081637.1 hypothetical protein [Aeromonas sp. MrichA-1]
MKTIIATKRLNSTFKKGRKFSWRGIPPSFGDVFYGKGGAVYKRGDELLFDDDNLPFILSENVLTGELIPQTSWGSSLANMLTRDSWNKLRHPIIKENSNACQVCGARKNSLDIHEIWSYEFLYGADGKKIDWGIQHLEGLICVCKECHEIFHLGLANLNNRLDKVLERLRCINRWSPATTKNYCDEVFNRWDKASEVSWILDLSSISHPDGGLTISKKWSVNDGGFLLCDTGRGISKTMIVNSGWKFQDEKEWRGITPYY